MYGGPHGLDGLQHSAVHLIRMLQRLMAAREASCDNISLISAYKKPVPIRSNLSNGVPRLHSESRRFRGVDSRLQWAAKTARCEMLPTRK